MGRHVREGNKVEVAGSNPGPGTNSMNTFKSFGIRWKEPVGLAECPYMVRWVLTFFGFSIRIHHWLASDDQRHHHDHPWWFVTWVLKGTYTDICADRRDMLTAGSIRFRSALHRHTVLVPSTGCWTLLVTGRSVRHWGFYLPNRLRLMRPLKYFSKVGHHPCE